MKNIEHVKCNLCGKDDYTVVYEGAPDEKSFLENFSSSSDVISKDRIVKCINCGLQYVNPRIKESTVIKAYSEGSDETFISQRQGREVTFDRGLKFIEKLATKGRILDIGTAGGSFLNVAQKRGWEIHGIEPNKWLCEWAKNNYGITVKPGTIFSNKFPKEHFDAVSMWDVLEHMSDPMKNLKEANRILKPGGLVIVNYPDIGSAVAKLMKRRWIFILAVHLYYFTPGTLSAMLRKAGFEPILFKKHKQLLSLDYLIKRMEPYSGLLYKIFNKLAGMTGANKLLIPYWLGQSVILARKK